MRWKTLGILKLLRGTVSAKGSYNVSDGVLDPFKDNFEAGKSKHDLIMKNATFELTGNYQCEAFHYPHSYSFDVRINVLGIIL